ncbi:MAG: nucleotide pyrophosphohydrolase [Phycisphaeraceae bacterium]|nr:nucleotide pyrophosphohydrolase [Phycisphaeraceae bacterium]
MNELQQLQDKILAFRDARDWKQFHAPKNLAEGLSIEAAELLENFLWKTTDQSYDLSDTELARVKDEVSDIFTFLMYLCHELKIDLYAETNRKIDENAKKYPVDKAKGNCLKYTEYEQKG